MKYSDLLFYGRFLFWMYILTDYFRLFFNNHFCIEKQHVCIRAVTLHTDDLKKIYFLLQEFLLEAPFLHSWDFTVFSLQHPLHTWMVTHPSANHGPSCLTSVILRDLVFPTWYCCIVLATFVLSLSCPLVQQLFLLLYVGTLSLTIVQKSSA